VIVTLYMCMPEGESMRRQFARLMNEVKNDNRRVIAAMAASGYPIADTVGELGLRYVPEKHRLGPDGEPVMNIYGMRAMLARKTFSCGDATAYEAAVLEEIYGVYAECLSVAQGDDDMHAVFVTPDHVVDPTANFLNGRREQVRPRPVRDAIACSIEDGRVVCDEEPDCCVDEDGQWSCPTVPGLGRRREPIVSVHGNGNARWARTQSGAVVPVCPPRRRGPR
jgi:hypothetical protein